MSTLPILFIDTYGRVYSDNQCIHDEYYIDTIYRNLHANTNDEFGQYRWKSVINNNEFFVTCEDTLLVFSHLDGNKLWYSPSGYVEFQPKDLRFDNTDGVNSGVLYHRSPIGNWGRISASLIGQLSSNIHLWGNWFRYHDASINQSDVIIPLGLSAENIILRPREENLCVGCGKGNPHSLLMTFVFNSIEHRVYSYFTAPRTLMGSLNIMHGGFVGLLHDETMGKILTGLGIKAPTAQLNVRYRKPVPIGEELYIQSIVKNISGRKYMLQSSISLSSNITEILSEAEALFIAPR